MKHSFVLNEYGFRNYWSKYTAQPATNNPVGLVSPENTSNENTRVEDGNHRLRTFSIARLMIVAAALADCRPAGVWANNFSTCLGDGGLSGRISNPESPRSKTFSGPPCSKPCFRHQSKGNTVCRRRVSVIVVAFTVIFYYISDLAATFDSFFTGCRNFDSILTQHDHSHSWLTTACGERTLCFRAVPQPFYSA